MPQGKEAMARYRVIDRLLADPQKDYTTRDIAREVSRSPECIHKVTIRMIQKDIKSLEEEFGRKLIRNSGGRGTVKYADQSNPIFYQELTYDEKVILKEALGSLGQFEGLENFKWLEVLKKKLDMDNERKGLAAISFAKNNLLQIQENLLGQLYSAITRRKVIRFGYRRFQDADGTYNMIKVYPYQLRQYNNRWYLLCNPVGNEDNPFNNNDIYSYALDRMDGKMDYVEDMQYIDTPVDIDARYDEVIGVTYNKDVPVEPICFAVKPKSVEYVMTKYLHPSQDEVNPEAEKALKKKYPSLDDCKFFIIYCRPNYELYSVFRSFGDSLVVVEPEEIRNEMLRNLQAAVAGYKLD